MPLVITIVTVWLYKKHTSKQEDGNTYSIFISA
jgi:hypothetical protein